MAWLRHWGCLLVGSLHPNEEKVLEEVTSRILSAHHLSLTESQKQRFKVCALLRFFHLNVILCLSSVCHYFCIHMLVRLGHIATPVGVQQHIFNLVYFLFQITVHFL